MLHILCKAKADVNKTSLGIPALSHAAMYAEEKCVRVLLKHGANPNLKATRGGTALHYACEPRARVSMKAAYRTVKLLCEFGADVNTSDGRRGTVETPLHVAADVGVPRIVEVLTAFGADQSATNADGQTPLDVAVVAQQDEDSDDVQTVDRERIAWWLREFKDYHTKLHYIFTPHISPARTRSLLLQRADIHARVGNSASPLEIAETLDELGHAPRGSPADIVIGYWTERYRALEQGTHQRASLLHLLTEDAFECIMLHVRE